MTLAQQFEEALAEVKRDYPDLTPDEQEKLATQFVTPAGDTEYSTGELINKGGFIGDPNVPGSNRFEAYAEPTASPAVASVQPAGMANELPGYNRYAQDLAAGYSEADAAAMSLHPVQEREKSMGLVLSTYGEVPKSTISSLEKDWNKAIDEYRNLAIAGRGYDEADALALAPVRDKTKRVAEEYKYREPTQKVSEVEKRLVSEVTKAGNEVKSAQENLLTKTVGVNTVVPGVTNVSKPIFGFSDLFGILNDRTNIVPPSTQWENPFTEPQVQMAQARLSAAQQRYNAATNDYAQWQAAMGRPTPAGAGFELRSSTLSTSPLKVGKFTVIPK